MQETMRRAIEAVGDIERLASALGASVSEIEACVAGHAVPPPGLCFMVIVLSQGVSAEFPRKGRSAEIVVDAHYQSSRNTSVERRATNTD